MHWHLSVNKTQRERRASVQIWFRVYNTALLHATLWFTYKTLNLEMWWRGMLRHAAVTSPCWMLSKNISVTLQRNVLLVKLISGQVLCCAVPWGKPVTASFWNREVCKQLTGKTIIDTKCQWMKLWEHWWAVTCGVRRWWWELHDPLPEQ